MIIQPMDSDFPNARDEVFLPVISKSHVDLKSKCLEDLPTHKVCLQMHIGQQFPRIHTRMYLD